MMRFCVIVLLCLGHLPSLSFPTLPIFPIPNSNQQPSMCHHYTCVIYFVHLSLLVYCGCIMSIIVYQVNCVVCLTSLGYLLMSMCALAWVIQVMASCMQKGMLGLCLFGVYLGGVML